MDYIFTIEFRRQVLRYLVSTAPPQEDKSGLEGFPRYSHICHSGGLSLHRYPREFQSRFLEKAACTSTGGCSNQLSYDRTSHQVPILESLPLISPVCV